MSGPNSKPEAGPGDYRTPPEFLAACLRRLGWKQFDWDLACELHNCVGVRGGWIHPTCDALAADWTQLRAKSWCSWLNPPFGQAGAFAAKAAESGAKVAALVPVALGTRWWRQHVHGRADVLGCGRLKFNLPDGTPAPAAINRDCALLRYGFESAGEYLLEDWRTW